MSKFQITLNERVFEIEIDSMPEADRDVPVRVNGETVHVRVPAHHERRTEPEWIVIGDRPYEVLFDREMRHLRAGGQAYELYVRDMETVTTRPISGDGHVKAPIPGIITQVMVAVGQSVAVGDPLVILEAMKMENQIRAPRSGTVSTLNVSVGRGVVLGEALAEIT